MALGSNQPLVQTNTYKLCEGWRQEDKADKNTVICGPTVLENVGASSAQNPVGFYGLLQG
jgi:hypothetical protein